jgi:hypothetical protein
VGLFGGFGCAGSFLWYFSTMGNWFYNHQTFVVGALGFAGVMATLWFNARSQRAQHQRDIDKSRQDRIDARDKAAAALRTALYQELNILSTRMSTEIRDMDNSEAKELWFTLMPITDVYDAFIGKIDLLTPCEIQRVMVAYVTRKNYIEELTQMSEDPNHSVVESAFKFHAKRAAFPSIKNRSITATEKVESAKAALAKHMPVLPDEK